MNPRQVLVQRPVTAIGGGGTAIGGNHVRI